MTKDQFSRELLFQVSVALVDEMLKKGVIKQDDKAKWREHLIQKYDPPLGQIVSESLLDF